MAVTEAGIKRRGQVRNNYEVIPQYLVTNLGLGKHVKRIPARWAIC